ncbi:hypothetical protein IW152_004705 [Coemansia sp. BCRC 34962]|nr:hypothetical protein IW152_004705 [Coemansia sp. BCRC 34962]
MEAITVHCEISSEQGEQVYLTIGDYSVSIRLDNSDELDEAITKLAKSRVPWKYSEAEFKKGKIIYTEGEPWIEFYPPSEYGSNIRAYRWSDFKVERSEFHIAYTNDKVVKKPELGGEENFKREVAALLKVGSHPNIGEFLGLVVEDGLVEGMVAPRYYPSGKLEPQDLIRVCDGLEYMHKRGAVHGDLHPGNIMRDKDGSIRIIDLGCNGYTEEWSAPEVLVGAPQSKESDVFSLALLCEANGCKMPEGSCKQPSLRCNVQKIKACICVRSQQVSD